MPFNVIALQILLRRQIHCNCFSVDEELLKDWGELASFANW